MKIKCINNSNTKGLTLNKIYECDGHKYGGICYCIINDFGNKENYFESHFEVLK